MVKKWFSVLVVLMCMAGAVPAGAQSLIEMGIPISPHGFPSYYGDGNVRLELCLPPPAGTSSRPDLCIFDPLDEESDLIVSGESFWWLAETSIPMPGGGDADLTLAIEATFGGDHSAVNGNQISFARTRIRVDTPVAGTYTVYLPYGDPIVFENVPAGSRGINYTADIGSTNFRDPATAFLGTLNGGIGPFLTWPNFRDNESLQVLELDEEGEPTGVILEQYVGDPNVPSVLTDGTDREIIFRVEGPGGIDVQTDLFFVMGKEFNTPEEDLIAHVFPDVPDTSLFAVGPVNREIPFLEGAVVSEPALQPGGLVTGVDYAYPFGYPLWYQEDVGTTEAAGGLALTLCPPFDSMCIGDPIDWNDDDMADFRTGGEQFWFLAEAVVQQGDNRFLLTLGVEATFGGTHAIVDGNQIAFGRERIRVDTPVAGTYRVTHPYGQRVFENLPAGRRAINFTSDIGITDPADPDNAFVGTLFSDIGPTFLTWPDYENNPALKRPLDPDNPETSPLIQYIGNPAIPSDVVGSPYGTNYFHVERLVNGNWVTVVFTEDFSLSGKVYSPQTFAVYTFGAAGNTDPGPGVPGQPDPVLSPVAASFAVSLDLAEEQSLTIDVLSAAANVVDPATINIVAQPVGGSLNINVDGTITYTPSAEFADSGGNDSFTYNITALNGTSNNAVISVTVIPVVGPVPPPVAASFAVTLNLAQQSSIAIDILGAAANVVDPATINIVAQPADGSAAVDNGAGTVTYTPSPVLAGAGGSDSFTYNIDAANGISNDAVITITVIPVPLAPPAASSLSATLNMAQQQSVTINILDAASNVVDPATINIVTQPADGSVAVNNLIGTATYTPDAAFAAVGGNDSFIYNIVASNGTSNNATITITVVPVPPEEVITVRRAQLQMRQLRWTIFGDSTRPGSTLTIYAGSTAEGSPIGTAVVADNGRWRLRTTTTSNPNVDTITIVNLATGETLTQPLQVR
jgi:hypothetical protein